MLNAFEQLGISLDLKITISDFSDAIILISSLLVFQTHVGPFLFNFLPIAQYLFLRCIDF